MLVPRNFYMMISLSLSVVPAKVLVDGTHKIRVAINHKHETRYLATRFSIDSIKQFKNGRIVGREDSVIINRRLRSLLEEYQDTLDKINEEAFTCGQIRKYLSQYKSVETTISQRWQEYINELTEDNRTGTAGLHQYTKKYFEKRFTEYVRFDVIGPAIVKDFDKFLRRKGIRYNDRRVLKVARLRSERKVSPGSPRFISTIILSRWYKPNRPY